MEHDRNHWNEKFKVRADRPLPPEAFLLRQAPLLKPGTVLDLACGDGRNAIHLAKHGFVVTAIDIADVALERLGRFSARDGVEVTTYLMDLEANPEALDLGAFDNVVVNHFSPSARLWNTIPRLLRTGGRFLICAFNMKQHQLDGTPERICLKAAGDKTSHPGLKLVHYESFVENDRFLDGYVFEKE